MAPPVTLAGEEQVLLRIGPARLALAGLTGAELGVIFAVVGGVAGWLNQVIDVEPDLLEGLDPTPVLPSGGVVIALGVALLAALWTASAAGVAVIRFAGYTLALAGDEIRARLGLFRRLEVTIPLRRVQVVRVQRSILRRGIGMAALRVQSAGDRTPGAPLTVPILALDEVPPLLGALLPSTDRSALDATSTGRAPLTRPPRAALHRAVLRRVMPALAVGVAAALLAPPLGLLVLGAVLPAAGWGVAYYRSLGHALLPDHLVARAGVLVQETVVVPIAKVQSVRVRSTWLQRRRGLATVYLDVAGGWRTPAVRDEAEARAQWLMRAVVERLRALDHGAPG